MKATEQQTPPGSSTPVPADISQADELITRGLNLLSDRGGTTQVERQTAFRCFKHAVREAIWITRRKGPDPDFSFLPEPHGPWVLESVRLAGSPL